MSFTTVIWSRPRGVNVIASKPDIPKSKPAPARPILHLNSALGA